MALYSSWFKSKGIPDWFKKMFFDTFFLAKNVPVAAKLKALAHILPEVGAQALITNDKLFSNQFWDLGSPSFSFL